MDPRLVLDGTEDLIDWGVEYRSLDCSRIRWEGALDIELLILLEVVASFAMVLILRKSSGVSLSFLQSLVMLRTTSGLF